MKIASLTSGRFRQKIKEREPTQAVFVRIEITVDKEVKLSESLAAALIQAVEKEYQVKIAEKETDIAKREADIRTQLVTCLLRLVHSELRNSEIRKHNSQKL